MNNIQKNFKAKSALRMADGGVVRDERLRRVDDMTEGRNAAAGQQPPTISQTGAPMPDPKTIAPTPGPMDNLKVQFSKLRKAVGLAEGGKVHGPGGPTDDKVPAMLSHGEFVLPADTVQAVGADKLEALRQATHTPAPGAPLPKSKSRLRMANGGGVGFDPTMDPILEMQKRARLVHAADSEFAASPRPAPAFSEATRGDQLAAESMQRAQEASRAASRAAYAAPEVAQAASPAETVANAAKSVGSRLRGIPGAAFDATKGLAGRVVAPLATGLRAVGTAAIPAVAGYNAVTDTPDQRAQVSGMADTGGTAQRLGQLGSYLGSALTLGAASPSDIGNITDTVNRAIFGNGTAAFQQVPRERQGWLTSRVLDATGENDAQRPSMDASSAIRRAAQIAQQGNAADAARVQQSADVTNYTTHDGRQGVLPAGIAVTHDKTGNPVFSGGFTPESQQVLQNAVAPAAAQSPLRPNLDAGSGFNMVNSRAGEINKHFDDLAKQIQELHGGARFHANGSLASKMLKLEEARADALGRDQSNLVGSQGNVVSDAGNRRSNASNVYGTDVAAQSALRRDQVTDEGNRLSTAAALYKAKQDDNKQNFEQTNTLLNSIFTTDKDGKANNKYGLTASEVQAQLARNPTVKINGQDVNINDLPPSQRVQAIISAAGGATIKNNINATAGLFGDQDSNAQLGGVVIPDSNPLDIPNLLQHHVSVGSVLRHGLNPLSNDDRVSQVSNGDYRYTDDITGDDADLEEMAGNTRKKK